jgi:hypothetical protein
MNLDAFLFFFNFLYFIYIYYNMYKQKYLKYKYKYLDLIKQIGGNNINIMFACTSLLPDSTLSVNFDTINKQINSLIEPINPLSKKIAYFVYKKPFSVGSTVNQDIGETKEKMEKNGYSINPTRDINLVDYIKQNKSIKYKIILLTQCSAILYSIIGEDKMNNESYDNIIINSLELYNSIEVDGFLIEYGYNSDSSVKLDNFENTSSQTSLTRDLPWSLFTYKILNKLFINISPGIYKKNNNLPSGITNIFENIKYEHMCKMQKIIKTKTINQDSDQKYLKNILIDLSENLYNEQTYNKLIVSYFMFRNIISFHDKTNCVLSAKNKELIEKINTNIDIIINENNNLQEKYTRLYTEYEKIKDSK